MIHKTYRTRLGALSEHHLIFHTRGAEKKMNFALKHASITRQRMFKH